MTTVADVSRISEEMLSLRQWVGWRMEQRDGKPTKVPVDPDSGRKTKTQAPVDAASTSWCAPGYARAGLVRRQ